MSYSVLNKKVQYANCPIYVRNTGENWEYFTIIHNEIYTASIIARKSAMQRLFGKDCTAKETSDITQYMLAMAQATIDTVFNIKHRPDEKL